MLYNDLFFAFTCNTFFIAFCRNSNSWVCNQAFHNRIFLGVEHNMNNEEKNETKRVLVTPLIVEEYVIGNKTKNFSPVFGAIHLKEWLKRKLKKVFVWFKQKFYDCWFVTYEVCDKESFRQALLFEKGRLVWKDISEEHYDKEKIGMRITMER
jgi:hypothetical protein